MKSEAIKLTGKETYLLEKERIQNEIGDLEQIRSTLGLSQRRLCQLLLVDPSAWTRWNKTSAPPHIFQALKWLLELRKSQPNVIEPSNLADRLDYFQSSTQNKVKQLETSLDRLEKNFLFRDSSTDDRKTSTASDELINITLLQAQSRIFQKEIENLKSQLDQMNSSKKQLQKPTRSKKSQGNRKRRVKVRSKIKFKNFKSKKKLRSERIKSKKKLHSKMKRKIRKGPNKKTRSS